MEKYIYNEDNGLMKLIPPQKPRQVNTTPSVSIKLKTIKNARMNMRKNKFSNFCK